MRAIKILCTVLKRFLTEKYFSSMQQMTRKLSLVRASLMNFFALS